MHFYLPVCAVTVVATTIIMLTKQVSRWAGAILVLLYVLFVVGGYLGWGIPLVP
jgi:hypothetical protein